MISDVRVRGSAVPSEQPLDLPDARIGLLDLLPKALVWDVHVLAARAGLGAVRAVPHRRGRPGACFPRLSRTQAGGRATSDFAATTVRRPRPWPLRPRKMNFFFPRVLR